MSWYCFHEAQVSVLACSIPTFPGIASIRSTNCIAKPSLTCHVIWQCINLNLSVCDGRRESTQFPGLLRGKAITINPPVGPPDVDAGIVGTSRRVGLMSDAFAKTSWVKFPYPEANKRKP